MGGFTLVQRIEARRLHRSGRLVRITLRASSTMDARIDSIWISQPKTGGDPYDPSDDLTFFYGKAIVRANTSLTLSDTQPDVNYHFEGGEQISPGLLIAVDFMRGAPSGIRFQDGVPPQDASAYRLPWSEAGKTNRTAGSAPMNRIYLIERIEVA